jgi:hypothetical protein
MSYNNAFLRASGYVLGARYFLSIGGHDYVI